VTNHFILWCLIGLGGNLLVSQLIYVAIRGFADQLDQDITDWRYLSAASFFNIVNCLWLLFWLAQACHS
jgi:hypothetical protein